MVRTSLGDPLTGVEALLWALGADDPTLRCMMSAIAVLDRTPGVELLASRVERLTRVAPRLRCRVVEGPVAVSTPRWVPDPDFDLAAHLRCVRAPRAARRARPQGWRPPPGGRSREGSPAGSALAAALALAQPFVSDAIDRARPPWQLMLVEDLPGGAAALVMKLHHSLADGTGALGLAAALFASEPGAELGPLPIATPPAPAGPLDAVLDDLAVRTRRSGRLLRGALSAIGGDLEALLAGSAEAAARRVELARSVASLARPAPTPRSPVLTGRSARHRLASLAVGVEDLRCAGRCAGGTINDAFLAGVLAGLRRYHEAHASRPAALRVAVPVSTRGVESASMSGNAVVPVRIDAPLQQLDPGERIRAVHRLVSGARREPALVLLEPLAATTQLAPLRAAVAASMAGVDLVASNLVGPETPLYLGDAEVQALVPFGPRAGAALNVTVLSYRGVMGFGLDIDPAAAPDSSDLVDAVAAGLAEVTGGPAAGAPGATLAQSPWPSTMEA
jgi:diacylglycerol O-acyltransferase